MFLVGARNVIVQLVGPRKMGILPFRTTRIAHPKKYQRYCNHRSKSGGKSSFQTCQAIERFTGHLRKNAMNWIYTASVGEWILLNFGFSENELTLQWMIIHNPWFSMVFYGFLLMWPRLNLQTRRDNAWMLRSSPIWCPLYPHIVGPYCLLYIYSLYPQKMLGKKSP